MWSVFVSHPAFVNSLSRKSTQSSVFPPALGLPDNRNAVLILSSLSTHERYGSLAAVVPFIAKKVPHRSSAAVGSALIVYKRDYCSFTGAKAMDKCIQ